MDLPSSPSESFSKFAFALCSMYDGAMFLSCPRKLELRSCRPGRSFLWFFWCCSGFPWFLRPFFHLFRSVALDAKGPSGVIEKNGWVLGSMGAMATQAGDDLVVPDIDDALPIRMAELSMLLMAFFTEFD